MVLSEIDILTSKGKADFVPAWWFDKPQIGFFEAVKPSSFFSFPLFNFSFHNVFFSKTIFFKAILSLLSKKALLVFVCSA